MRRSHVRSIALFALGILHGSVSAKAADFWARSRGGAPQNERDTVDALFRADAGTSDALDELLVRTAIVDVARGRRYEDALTLVYVLRTRRHLGLSTLPGAIDLLEAVMEQEQSVETRALAGLELGRLLRLAGDDARSRTTFDAALAHAWRSEVRVEGYLMRGWLAVEARDFARARADFQAVLAFDLGRSQLGLALSSLAHVELERGDVPAARVLSKRARQLEAGGAAISPTLPSDRPELLPQDQRALVQLDARLAQASAVTSELR